MVNMLPNSSFIFSYSFTALMPMLEFLHPVLAVQPLFAVMRFLCAWGFIIFVGWTVLLMVREAAKQTSKMHQIPCSNCKFFTDNYTLKCAVNPSIALTEAAIHCPDYRSADLYPPDLLESSDENSLEKKGASLDGTPVVSRSYSCPQ
jgi:hypothetical protein